MLEWAKRHRFKLAIAGVLILAAFMRLWRLDTLPPGLHPDEAANGLDIFSILNGDHRPFYSRNGGRESLFFYFQSIGVMIFGNTILALRLAPALIGTAAVGATYLWVSSWFGRRAAIIAALVMAVTPWGVIISRDGFRAGMVALMVPLTLWLITRAFQTGRSQWFVFAGISFGAGFYTYIAFRLFPAALLAMLVFVFIWRRQWLRKWGKKLILTAAAMAIVLIPMGLYGIKNPGDIAGRPGGVSITNPDVNKGDLIGTATDVFVKTALMFNIRGDENYRHGIGGQPMLNAFTGIMFLLGIILAVANIRRFAYFALLMVFGAMLLPELLTAEGIPHGLRAIGALPPTMALVGVGTAYMLSQWHSIFPLNPAARLSGTIAVSVLLALTVWHGYVSYFVAWANDPETYEAYGEDNVQVAYYFNNNKFNGKRYAVTGPYHMQTVEYLTRNKSSYELVDTPYVDSIPLDKGVAKEFLFYPRDKEKVLPRLKLKFPKGHLSPHYSSFSGKELFATYTVPAS